QTLHIRVRFSSDKKIKINVDVFVRSVFKEQSFNSALLEQLYHNTTQSISCQHNFVETIYDEFID
ncbi:hypothetical protein, partial [Bacillus sp. UMB0728]|uniref:hypothetical protein n=1 Tax=Bacillus sp. UMB0728 TaxID=2066052 RepID=UPI000CAECE57